MSDQLAIPLFIERLRAIEAACAHAIDLLLKKRGRAEEFIPTGEYESLLWIQSTCEHWRIIITYWHQESRGRNVPLRCTLEWMGEDLRLEMLRSARTVDPHRAARRAKIYVLHGIRQAWTEIVGAERIRQHLAAMVGSQMEKAEKIDTKRSKR